MPHHIKRQEEVLEWMHRLHIFSELVARTGDGGYENELDLDVILYGRGYTGGRVGPYVRLLRYEAGEELIREDEWSMQPRAQTARESRHGGTSGGGGDDDDSRDRSEREWDGNSFFVLADGTLHIKLKDDDHDDDHDDDDHDDKHARRAKQGSIIGAMMLLEGDPADYTVVVPEGAHAIVLEFKRPAIRLLRKYREFAQAFDADYRKYGLRCVLRDVTRKKLAGGLGASDAQAPGRVRGLPAAPSVGNDHWKEITKRASFEVFDRNHLLFQSGRPITHVLLVKKGWIEVAQDAAGGSAAAARGATALPRIHYLGAGNCFGLEAITNADATWNATATLLARTELLVLPVEDLRAEGALAEAVRGVFSDFSTADEEKLLEDEPAAVSEARRQEITSGLVDGTNLLVMDMDLCVRCGNCSLACHKVHGQSRLLRRGIQIERPPTPAAERLQHVLAPSVCLHCQDPECLTGCPTGSIARYPAGQIDINPQTCIGCGDCATQCPYNAISLVPRKDVRQGKDARHGKDERRAAAGRKPADAPPPRPWRQRLKERAAHYYRLGSIRPEEVNLDAPPVAAEPESLVAVKCNLCHGTSLNPEGASRRTAYSCEENCPTGALVRVNPREYFSEIGNVVGTIYIDQTHAIGRNIHRRDTPARLWHVGGTLATLASLGACLWAAERYGLNTPLPGTVWTLRWLTGFAGLGGLAVSLAYLLRKQIYRRRAGPLRYWLLAHVYFSLTGAAMFLVHGGRHTGSALTSALMVSFDLVILSGLFGLVCYKLAPRIMTRIEEQPLLIEDLRARRAELQEELRQLDESSERLRALIRAHVRGRFLAGAYLWRQFLRRESLTQLQARARAEFDRKAQTLELDRSTRAQLVRAVETAATARRVEALIYLHGLLKLWVAPHVAFTMLMLVLLAAHLVQVFFFAVH